VLEKYKRSNDDDYDWKCEVNSEKKNIFRIHLIHQSANRNVNELIRHKNLPGDQVTRYSSHNMV